MKTATFLVGVLAISGFCGCGGGGGSGGGDGGTTTTTDTGGGGTGGTATGGTATGGTATGGTATGGTATGGTGTGGAEVQCTGDPPVFPTFDKTCGADMDCALVFHQINCCGTRIAIGINHDESGAFAAAEAVCEGQYPPCGCAQQPTMAEDGQTGDEGAMLVQCDAGSCQSYVP